LRWLCGFANAAGGLLEVGRNDASVALGGDAAKRMQNMPNKMCDVLGLMAEVNLVEEVDHSLFQIQVIVYPQSHQLLV
jgi:ATP-dependent DNA helicase RecG